MAERIITIEIGTRITRVCETDYKGQGDVHNFFTFETPEGTLENQMVKEGGQFRYVLDEQLQRHKVRTRKAVFAVSAKDIGTKEEVVPVMKENRTKEYLKTNMTTFFPVNADEYQVAYRVNGPAEEGKSRMQLYAVNNKLVKSYENLAKSCGLNLLDIEFSENGVAQKLRKAYPKGTVVNVAVEETHSVITIVKDGFVALQRNVPYGIGEAVMALQESDALGIDLSFMQVLNKMKETSCIYTAFTDLTDAYNASSVKDTVTENLRYLIGNISRILEYYVSQNHGVAFDKAILSGIGGDCKDLDLLLQSETGCAFERAGKELLGHLPQGLSADIASTAFASASAGLMPIGISLSTEKKQGLSGLVKDSEDTSTAKKVFVLCIVLSLALVLYSAGKVVLLRLSENTLRKSIASMAEAKKVNDEYVATKAQYEELLQICGLTDTPNDALLELFREMEDQIPTEAIITEMEANAESLNIYFKVPSKEVAAMTMQAFRGFESVYNVSMDELVKEETDDEANPYYTFMITCYYHGTGPEAVPADGTATDDAAADGTQTTDTTADTTDSTQATDGTQGAADGTQGEVTQQ